MSKNGRSSGSPAGREAVVAAVLAGATDLFVERGPAATSIRDIADRAGVNHGLVFRHFGTKEKVVGAVLDQLGTQAATMADSGELTPTDPRLRRHWVVLARCILDGFPVGELQYRFPLVTRLVEQVGDRVDGQRDAALLVGHVAALELGWQLFAPFLRVATGLQDIPDADLQHAIDALAAQILRY